VKPLTSAEVTETPSSCVTVAKPVPIDVWTVAEPRLLGHLTTYAHVLIDD
jgi:hypothetical protein